MKWYEARLIELFHNGSWVIKTDSEGYSYVVLYISNILYEHILRTGRVHLLDNCETVMPWTFSG